MIPGDLIIGIVTVGFCIAIAAYYQLGLWVSALEAKLSLNIFNLIGIKNRGINPQKLLLPLIKGKKAGLPLTINQLESHYLAGGDPDKVVNALIIALRADMEFNFNQAAVLDLTSRDVEKLVKASITPRVFELLGIRVVAGDGRELITDFKVTMRLKLEDLITKPMEDTLFVKLAERINNLIANTESYQTVVAHPEVISQKLLSQSLDVDTVYEIINISLIKVDIGRNLEAELQLQRAETEKALAQIRSEERKFLAIAKEAEMQALAEERRAQVIEAESELPKAIVAALQEGKLGVMDYYQMQNLRAGTKICYKMTEELNSKATIQE